VISVTDKGRGIPNLQEISDGQYVSKTGVGMGLIGTKRLLEHFHIVASEKGTQVECGKSLPVTAATVTVVSIKAITAKLAVGNTAEPFHEIESRLPIGRGLERPVVKADCVSSLFELFS
jgi:hypothetical protein